MEQKNTVPMLEKALDILEYIGASDTAVSLPELQAKAKFIRVSSSALQEAHPHDILMLKDAPNYTQKA